MEARILFVSTLKTTHVLLVISMFMICKKGVLCDYCEQKIHRKCARLTKQKYEEFETKDEEIWYCRMCTRHIPIP